MEVILYKPHSKQKEVHSSCNSRMNFFTIVDAGRQAGKTLCAQNQAIYWCMKSRVRLWFVEPTDSQCQRVYEEMILALRSSGLIKSSKASSGSIQIKFINGSLIEFKTAAAEDSLRGAPVDYMIIDEAAFIKRSTIEEILLPTMNVKGKHCLIISTPKGKNWFYDYYLKGLNDSYPQYKSFKFLSTDNPKSNKELIETFKQSMPLSLFRQEFEGEFIDSLAIFQNVNDCIGQSTGSETYYGGIDIGLINDYTVVTILNQKGEMVFVDRFTNVTAPDLKNRISETLNRFKPKKTYIEKNNQGLPIYQDLKQDYKIDNLEPFDTTAKSKEDIIDNLINAFAEKRIKIIDNKDLIIELEAFTLSYSPSGKIKYSAPNGFHDDLVMSLAIAYECFLKHKSKGSFDYVFAQW